MKLQHLNNINKEEMVQYGFSENCFIFKTSDNKLSIVNKNHKLFESPIFVDNDETSNIVTICNFNRQQFQIFLFSLQNNMNEIANCLVEQDMYSIIEQASFFYHEDIFNEYGQFIVNNIDDQIDENYFSAEQIDQTLKDNPWIYEYC